MTLTALFNPFTRIDGFSALLCGCTLMLLTAAIAAPSGIHFGGTLTIQVVGVRHLTFGLVFSLLLLGWLNAATFFYIAGLFFFKSKIRAVDMYGTFALARAPLLVAALFALLLGMGNIDVKPGQMPMEFWIFAVIYFACAMWVIVLCYNAFAVLANVKSKRLFAAVLIVSEIADAIVRLTFAYLFVIPAQA